MHFQQKFQDGQCLSCGEQGCGVLGLDSDYYFATGMLFLNTRQDSPFCGNTENIQYKLFQGARTTTTNFACCRIGGAQTRQNQKFSYLLASLVIGVSSLCVYVAVRLINKKLYFE